MDADGSEAWTSYNAGEPQLFSANNDDNTEMLGMLKSLAEEVATLHAKVDKIDAKVDNLASNGFVNAAQSSSAREDLELDDETPLELIGTHEKFDELEQKLKLDSAYRTDLVSHRFSCFRVCTCNINLFPSFPVRKAEGTLRYFIVRRQCCLYLARSIVRSKVFSAIFVEWQHAKRSYSQEKLQATRLLFKIFLSIGDSCGFVIQRKEAGVFFQM